MCADVEGRVLLVLHAVGHGRNGLRMGADVWGVGGPCCS
jgi:hypothetical protein